MTTTHTPGPHRPGFGTSGEIYIRAEESDGQPYLAQVLTCAVGDEQAKANALLFAAASDLLAALEAQSAPAAHFRQCYQCGADLRGNTWHCSEYARLMAKASDMAALAIAKAKEGGA